MVQQRRVAVPDSNRRKMKERKPSSRLKEAYRETANEKMKERKPSSRLKEAYRETANETGSRAGRTRGGPNGRDLSGRSSGAAVLPEIDCSGPERARDSRSGDRT